MVVNSCAAAGVIIPSFGLSWFVWIADISIDKKKKVAVKWYICNKL